MPHSEAVESPEADPTAPSEGTTLSRWRTAMVLRRHPPWPSLPPLHGLHAMAFAVVHSRVLRRLEAPSVTVEVHLANGLPSFTLVGLADPK